MAAGRLHSAVLYKIKKEMYFSLLKLDMLLFLNTKYEMDIMARIFKRLKTSLVKAFVNPLQSMGEL